MAARLTQTRSGRGVGAAALLLALWGALRVDARAGPHDETAAAIAAFRAGDHGGAVAGLRGPAADGDADAQFYLGLAYAKGWGVIADADRARDYYARAATSGHVKAQVNLALTLADAGEVAAARGWLERAAQQGDGRAAHQLGLMHYRGVGGPRDFVAAREWWQQGAAQGSAEAAFNLGIVHRRGLGVVPDREVALDWWLQAAYGGLAAAQNAVGAAYQNGDGAAYDLPEAWAWFRLAGAGGLDVARLNAELVAARLDAAAQARAEERLAVLRAKIATLDGAPRGTSE